MGISPKAENNSSLEKAKSYFSLGLDAFNRKHYESAEKYFRLSLDFAPDRLSILTNLSATLIKLGKFDEALKITVKALEKNPFDELSLLNLGILSEKKSDSETALIAYERAISISPQYAEAYNNRGNLLRELTQFHSGLINFNHAINLKYNFAEAHTNCGNLLRELDSLDEALLCHDKAINIDRNYAEAHSNRGLVLHKLNRLFDAILSYDKAIEIDPSFAEAYSNRGSIFSELKQFDNAYSDFKQAITLNADINFICGALVHTKMHLCNWENFEIDLENLLSKIHKNLKIIASLPLIALIDAPILHKKVSEIWSKTKHPSIQSLGSIEKLNKRKRIKIAYFSPDFRNHPVAQWISELFELHDRTRFEIIGVYFGPKSNDDYHNRISKSFDTFLDISDMSDPLAAKFCREIQIDIAIDLAGYTNYSRTNIFAYRVAPVQINYIGFPSTMGAEYIDYIIADEILIPKHSQNFYTEKIVYLPFTFKPTDTKFEISDKVFTREMFSLPANSFVFCCFNNNYKILPTTFDSWMRILGFVEHSVLWLAELNITAKNNLYKEAESRGINPNRLIFSPRLDKLADHIARLKLADLFLDTFTYNAHTTASDALWAGLPILTCLGESFASRVAASLLSAIQLPELISITSQEYENKAVDLAKNPEKLKALKDKLNNNIHTTPLFDMPRFTKYLETAYTTIYERTQTNLPPDNIYIQA